MALAADASMPQVRAVASAWLGRIADTLAESSGATDADGAHYRLVAEDIARFLERPATEFSQPAVMEAPPGAPIGQPALRWLRSDPGYSWLEEWWRDR
jgi:hypothetical protein